MTASRVARVVWVVVVVAVLAAAVLSVWSHDRFPAREAVVVVVGLVLGIVGTTVGTALASARPRHPLGWLLLAFGATFAMKTLLSAYAVAGILARHPLAGARTAGWLQSWVGLLVYPGGLAALLVLFPTGRVRSRLGRAALGVACAGGVLVLAERLLEPAPVTAGLELRLGYGNPTAVHTGWVHLLAAGWPLSLVALILAVAELVRRAHAATRDEHRALRLLAATGVLLAMTATLAVPVSLADRALRSQAATVVAVALAAEAGVLLPLVLAAAVLNRSMFGIQHALDRGLQWLGLTCVAVSVYVGAVLYLTTLVGPGDDDVLRLIATFSVALLFQPLRQWTGRGAARLVYGPLGDPRAAVLALAAQPAAPVAPLAHAVRRALGADAVVLELAGRCARSGTDTADLVLRALHRQGAPVGSLAVDAATLGHLPGPQRRLLDVLAGELARVGFELVQGARLEQAQAALLAAAAEERRRLRHDLHDGVGPALSGLRMKVAAARRQLPESPQSADSVLDQVAGDLEELTIEVRRVLVRMTPGLLAGRGLGEALKDTAVGLGLACTVEVDPLVDTLPAEQLGAALRVLQEAVHNVAQHAAAGRCAVRVALAPAGLEADVEDDGIGLRAGRQGGLGLVSMRQRAADHGGALVVVARPGGGTRVHLTLPRPGSEVSGA